MEKMNYNYEIIVVNDASKDTTWLSYIFLISAPTLPLPSQTTREKR